MCNKTSGYSHYINTVTML